MSEFDPSGVAVKNGNFLGFPKVSLEESEFVFQGIPWDVTTSYRPGTHLGPEAILDASYQLDLFSPVLDRVWDLKIQTESFEGSSFQKTKELNHQTRALAEAHIEALESGEESPDPVRLKVINEACEEVYFNSLEVSRALLKSGKALITLGGDHSISLGPMMAHAEKYSNLSVLHFDAHADLRDAYEGFSQSHASIMFNALNPSTNLAKHKTSGAIQKLVQVGIRDVSKFEVELAQKDNRIQMYFDRDLKAKAFEGVSWAEQAKEIVSHLTENVYLSFDIDGLDPKLCPNTGTPVPGGMSFEEAVYLIHLVHRSGRKLVGADLVEVAPDPNGSEWDANVGARLAFEILVALAKSRKS